LKLLNISVEPEQISQALEAEGPAHLVPSTLDMPRPKKERRQLGAFYTPERLSNLLADWAIRSPSDTILEPSFGGCGFLASARNALLRLGAARPSSQLFGCDIDPTAFRHLKNVLGQDAELRGFIQADFLDCVGSLSWPSGFDVVLANPPYIPHHRIGKSRVKELRSRSWPVTGMIGRCSLWAYFIVHSLTMLNRGGRMAWVLPGAFLQADYAKPIKTFLAASFDRVATVVVRDRLFLSEGTDEETVVLLADGFRAEVRSGQIELGAAETLDELHSIVAGWESATWKGDTSCASPAALGLSDETSAAMSRLNGSPFTRQLGDYARVQIGIVTGANDFFVLNDEGLKKAGLESDDCNRVLSKFKASPGLMLVEADLDRYNLANGRTYLVTAEKPETNDRIRQYLSTFSEELRRENSTFKKRAVWSATDDGRRPDAFFPVMHHTGPRLVLNGQGCTSTNTIHRVFFHTSQLDVPKLLAITLLTSFSQISAELIGRRYGSGVLKHEPRDAEKIPLLMPPLSIFDINESFGQIDALLREGHANTASIAADALIYRALGVEHADEVSEVLRASLMTIRARRRPLRGAKRD
jgi:hypothetical protein